jgi:uronate dehydrogenase
MQRVLLTGASGGVGRRLRKLMRGIYPQFRISDLVKPDDLQAHEEFVQADLTDPAALRRAVDGIEGIIHLGGYSIEGSWQQILQANIIGCHNLFETAHQCGVQRVVFASSNHAVGFYPRARKIPPEVIPLPDTRYGVSKVFGEALGALYAYKHGMRVLSIRIGNVDDRPVDKRRLSIWLKPEDLVQLIRIGLEHPDIRYEVVYGASDNARSWWDNSNAYRLGYQPSGRGEEFVAHAMAEQEKLPADPLGDAFQGGSFCSLEYDGAPLDRILKDAQR